MSIITNYIAYINTILFIIFIGLSNSLSAQNSDSLVSKTKNFTSVVTLTNKGISTIPNLTLGKPAVIFDMILGRRLTFEPQFRFALEGKPWSIILWWRYKVLSSGRFRLMVGANPSLGFKTITDISSGNSTIRADRYVAGEIFPNFMITKNINSGLYYFYTRGLETYVTRNANMLSFRSNFTNIPITHQISARFSPQLYYLKMDERDGTFLNASLVISKKKFPLSISALVNKKIKSTIASSTDLLWNVSLIYTFHKDYVEKF